MPDAWRAYLEMALGLTEAPRKRAQKVVGELANRGGATATQMQGLVEELMSAGVANREALTNIVRHEVDRALGVVGLATVQEVDELNTRVRDLERQLRDERAKVASDEETGFGGTRLDEPVPLPRKAAVKKVAKKAVKATPNAMPSAATTSAPAKKAAKSVAETPAPAPAKKTAASAPAKKAAAPAPAKTTGAPTPSKTTAPSPAKKTAVPTPAKKTAATKAVAKKAVAKKVPGTAEAPTAGVREAAAETVLPPAKKAAPGNPEASA